MRISDWSSDVCSSDLGIPDQEQDRANYTVRAPRRPLQIPAGNRLDRARSALAPPKLACPCQRSADAIPALACLHRAPCGHCRARPASLRRRGTKKLLLHFGKGGIIPLAANLSLSGARELLHIFVNNNHETLLRVGVQ